LPQKTKILVDNVHKRAIMQEPVKQANWLFNSNQIVYTGLQPGENLLAQTVGIVIIEKYHVPKKLMSVFATIINTSLSCH
jgi:hypothetical protein